MPFNQQFEQFTNTGCFSFKNGTLNPHHFQRISKFLDDTPPPELQLEAVHLQTLPMLRQQEPIIGPITSKEYARKWHDEYADLMLHDWSTGAQCMNVIHHDFSEPLASEFPGLKELYDLLSAPANWKRIALKNIFLGETDYLIWNPQQLIPLFRNNPNLTSFSCPIGKNESTREVDYNISFRELTKVIATHLNLQSLDLQNSQLSKRNYEALNEMLDTNYTLKVIAVDPPEDKRLLVLHQALQTRLATAPYKRFVNEQLTQEKLVELTKLGLGGRHSVFNLLLQRPPEYPAPTDIDKDMACKQLPTVYRINQRLLKGNYHLLHVNLDQRLENGKRLGAHLIEEVLKPAEKVPALIETLLICKANPVERFADPLFFSKLFIERKRTDWKDMIINYMQKQDWLDLIPQTIKLSERFPKLYELLSDLKKVLDKGLRSLMDYIESPLLDFLYKYNFRCCELEAIYPKLINVLQKATADFHISVEHINDIEGAVDWIIDATHEAPRGWHPSLNFNPELLTLAKALKEELGEIKRRLNELSKEFAAYKEELQAYRALCEDLKNQKQKLEIMLNESTAANNNQLMELYKKIASLQQLHAQEKSKYEKVFQDNLRLEELTSQSKAKVEALLQEKQSLEKKVEELCRQIGPEALLSEHDCSIREALDKISRQISERMAADHAERMHQCKEELREILNEKINQATEYNRWLQSMGEQFRPPTQNELLPEVQTTIGFFSAR